MGWFSKTAPRPKTTGSKRPTARRHVPRITYGPLGPMASTGYSTATNMARTDGVYSATMSGDAHMAWDRLQILSQSRDFYRNNAIYQGIIDRAVAYIVGGGFGLIATTPDEKVNATIHALWDAENADPEIRGLWSGAAYEQLICREWLVAGDVLERMLPGGKLQCFEAEQVRDQTFYGSGVVLDRSGRPLEFKVGAYTEFGDVNPATISRYPASQCLFTCNPDRPTSTRGIPACQSSFPMLHRINDVCDSEALVFQIVSRLAISVTRENGPGRAFVESDNSGMAGFMADRVTDIGTALMFHGEKGEEIKGIDHNVPGQNFPESITMFLRLLGLPLGLPLEIVLLDWSRTSYSSSRAVLEQAYQTFTGRQRVLISRRYEPLYKARIAKWQALGLVPIGEQYLSHEWNTPSWPWIDQLKEVEANGKKIDRAFATHAAVCKSLYADRDAIVKQRDREIRQAIALVDSIKTDTGRDVPYQAFCGMEIPAPYTKAGGNAVPPEDDGKQEMKGGKEDPNGDN